MSYSVIGTGRNNVRQSEAIFGRLSAQEHERNRTNDALEAQQEANEDQQKGQITGMAITNSPKLLKAGKSLFVTDQAAPISEATPTMGNGANGGAVQGGSQAVTTGAPIAEGNAIGGNAAQAAGTSQASVESGMAVEAATMDAAAAEAAALEAGAVTSEATVQAGMAAEAAAMDAAASTAATAATSTAATAGATTAATAGATTAATAGAAAAGGATAGAGLLAAAGPIGWAVLAGTLASQLF